jgi:hypothetical protein
MKKGIDLPTNLGIIKDTFPQGSPVDRSIGLKKELAVLGAKGFPARLVDIQQPPAALINVNERDQAIARQQTTYTTFSRSYTTGNAKNKGLHRA